MIHQILVQKRFLNTIEWNRFEQRRAENVSFGRAEEKQKGSNNPWKTCHHPSPFPPAATKHISSRPSSSS
jgi:hypothetical protein